MSITCNLLNFKGIPVKYPRIPFAALFIAAATLIPFSQQAFAGPKQLNVGAAVSGQPVDGSKITDGTVKPSAVTQQPGYTTMANCTSTAGPITACTAAQEKAALAITASDVSGVATALVDRVGNTAGEVLLPTTFTVLDASGGSVSDTLQVPTPANIGMRIGLKKIDTSANTITVTYPGPSGTTTSVLRLLNESKIFRQITSSTYTVESGDTPLTQLDLRYVTAAQAAAAAPVQNVAGKTGNVNLVPGDIAGLAAIATSGSAADLGGTLPKDRLPALTGDVTSAVGTGVLSIAASSISTTKISNQPANTFLGNPTGSSGLIVAMSTATANTLLGGPFLPLSGGALTGGITAPVFNLSGNVTAPDWLVSGIALSTQASTYTDSTSSGTIAAGHAIYSIQAPTIAATSATTYSGNYATMRIGGAPIAGTNVTLGSPRALHVTSGSTLLDGGLGVNGNVSLNASSTGFVNISTGTTPANVTIGGASNSVIVLGATFRTSASLAVTQIGQGLRVAEGANAKQGVATLALGTVTVANTSVTASSRIIFGAGAINASTAIGALHVTTQTPNVGFTVTSLSAAATAVTGDVSTFAYQIFEPG